jgi:hypothetical protein
MLKKKSKNKDTIPPIKDGIFSSLFAYIFGSDLNKSIFFKNAFRVE